MRRLLGVTLGVLTAIGGFVDIGDLVTNALVADGPPRGLTGSATLRVHGLVLSGHHTGSMLGYDRRRKIGPALVAAIVRWLHRDARYAGWQHVTAVEEHRVRLDVELAELPPLL